MPYLRFSKLMKMIESINDGEVTEWLMVQSWKDCVLVTVPEVRILSSPPVIKEKEMGHKTPSLFIY
jgi:hypothetical protein